MMNNLTSSIESALDEGTLVLLAKKGDTQAIRRLVEQYTALIVSLSGRFYIGTHALLTREELIQAGYVGLLDAVAHYDIAKKATLRTYAFEWILGEMRRTVKRSVDHAGGYEKMRQIHRMQAALEAQNSSTITLGDIAKACNMPIWQAATLIQMEEITHIEAQNQEPMHRSAMQMEERVDLHLALEMLTEQERQVILLRYYRGMSQMETARVLGKSQTQVSRIEHCAINRMKDMLA